MTLIDTDRRPTLSAYFMQSASRNLEETTSVILSGIAQALKRGGTADSAVKHTTEVNICDADDSVVFKLPIRVAIGKCALASEILEAAFRDKLRIQSLYVVSSRNAQARLVLLIETRVVGQLFLSRDGQSLRLQIKERPDARVMDNGVLALGRLEVSVLTPLGLTSADNLH